MADAPHSKPTGGRPSHLRAVSGGLQPTTPAEALVRRVAADVQAAWHITLGDAFDTRELPELTAWISSSILAHSTSIPVGDVPSAPVTLTRFLLERMHSAILAAAEEYPTLSRADVIRLLRGIDALRQRLEPDWDRYFSSQITGPDGLSMVTDVLHDVRSPLTSIRCLAEMLEKGQSGPVTEPQRKQLRLIYSAALGIGSMATDVIEMARQGTQVTDAETVSFSVSELLESVETMVRPIAEEKGLQMSFGQLASDQRIGEPHALGRVLLNLVTNALKFTDTGVISVNLRPLSMSRVEFSVTDTGRGIPDDVIPHLFRPFRRSGGRANRSGYFFSGTGLGLALCRKLLRNMGSDLRFETESGRGTRFFFEVELPTQHHL
jgi:signal transduction histidine kinase